jgi:hypothetical protein
VVGVAAAAEGPLPPAVGTHNVMPTETSARSLAHVAEVVAAAIPAVKMATLVSLTVKTRSLKPR